MSALPQPYKPDAAVTEPLGQIYEQSLQRLVNNDAEQMLLGAILINNNALARVPETLTADHFAYTAHGRIFDACRTRIDRGEVANPVTLKGLFDQDEALREIGGAQYMVKLVAAVVSVIGAPDYAAEIMELSRRRELFQIALELVEDTLDRRESDRTADDISREVGGAIDGIAAAGKTRGELRSIRSGLEAAVEHVARSRRGEMSDLMVMTGLAPLDQILGGLQPSDLMILAARPSMGKTALALQIAYHVSATAPVAFFSLEMSEAQLGTRMLSHFCGIPVARMRDAKSLSDAEEQHLSDMAVDLSERPLHVDDTPASSVAVIRQRAKQMQRRHGLRVIIVDYLQLITPGNTQRNRQTNRTNDVTDISAGLKALAKELDVPVIALSQLSRALETREDKRPGLSDLRESGAIEQDADQVTFIYREGYYLRHEPKQRLDEADSRYAERVANWRDRVEQVEGRMDLLVAKNRHGAVADCAMHFEATTGRVSMLQDTIEQGEF